MIRVNVKDCGEISVKKGTKLDELSKACAFTNKYPVVLAKVNNEIQELHRSLSEDSNVEFLDITDPNGFRAYQRSLVFLMVYAAREVLGRDVRVVVEHSINKNYFCVMPDDGLRLTQEILKDIEDKMHKTAKKNLPFEKISIPLEEAVAHARALHLPDKETILKYRRTSNVNFYRIDWLMDYFYGPMLPGTGYLTVFRLVLKDSGFILQFPSPKDANILNKIEPREKIYQVFQETLQWSRILNVDTVGALNDVISSGGLGDIIRIAEALQEKKIALIADEISRSKKRIVLIAGPSSSGKTTFAERLCIQLRVNGLRPHVISLDNYFKGREHVPLDENGMPDYEAFEYMDSQRMNRDLAALLKGDTVQMPYFNFLTGQSEFKGKYLTLTSADILVLEGIHGLNEELTENISRENKFKIFISALTQLNMDDHNRIPTSDARLIRRIVRDYQFRGMDAERTIGMWPSVLRGEARAIFPYQDEADALFNSALVYEMCVLKQYVEPLLFRIEKRAAEYTEARRLIKCLDSFLGADSADVPKNSLLREFIGGSCFKA